MHARKIALSFLLGLVACFTAAVSIAAPVDDYPSKPIRIIVPFSPGGATDSLARVLGEFLNRELGQPVIVDNRSGAGTMIGSEAVVKARPDGYTFLLNVTSVVQAPYLLSKMPFDPVKDLTPVAQLVTTPLVLAVRSDSGIKTPQDLVAKVKAEPGKHVYGSYGAGSSGHLYMHAFTEQNDLDWLHIPYRGEAPSVTDLLGGQITAVIMSGVGSIAHVKEGGRMTALAVTGPYRMPAMPDVPTFHELGYKRMSTRGWFGMFAPAGVDEAIVEKISSALMLALKDPEVVQRIENLSLIIDPLPAKEFAPVVKQDNDMWSAIIKEVGVKLD